jgi:hypothetical protein
LGEHNVPIFCQRLGISRDELSALQSQGVI